MVDSDNQSTLSPKEKLLVLKDKLLTRGGKIGLSTSVGILLLTLLMMKACAPAQGSILYGVCSAFLEQQLQYPEMMEKNYVEQYGSGVRIYYTQVDGFGQYLNEFIECSFAQDQKRGLYLSAVVFNTIKSVTKKTTIKDKGYLYKVEKKYINHFNESGSIQAIISSEPDLTLPRNDPFVL